MASASAANGSCDCSGGRGWWRPAGPWAPQAAPARRHDHSQRPNQRWGTDATLAWTRTDGWVWVFAGVDHYTAEAWAHVAKVGDRFAALQPVDDAVIDRWGHLDPDIARGLQLRHDWGPQYRSAHFTGSLAWLGINDSPAFLVNPRPTAAPNGGSAPSRSSACGQSCTTASISWARLSAASSTATTPRG